MRAVARLLTVVALVASALATGVGVMAPTAASAADLSYFKPGNIISDAVFFDSLSTDTATVQAFLQTKGAKCVAGEMPCLKDYTQTTADQAGDAYCGAYQGATKETAAAILVKIGRACGINPRVLLVLLQKEQGLITGTTPSARAYTKATGFGCPDTAACNPAFSGFVSQVYFAARQFQRYAAEVAGSYRAGRDNTVLYNPKASCGSSTVYIQNKATAGLYSYTPYQPNAAALAAGYGTGDACSSYGNRNFWNYFTDWFGSTQSSGGSAIYTEYQSLGGATGPLGASTTGFSCGLTEGGCWQTFAHGRIYWSPAGGAHAVTGDVLTRWAAAGAENGSLGYPLTDSLCGLTNQGCYQIFGGGSYYTSPSTGLHLLSGDIRKAWQKVGAENGVLGYPTTDVKCGLRLRGCWQGFTGGRIDVTPTTGARVLSGTMFTRWLALGAENGTLGYPLTNAMCGLVRSGCYQMFEKGSLYSAPSAGTHFIRGGILDSWQTARSEYGALGYPTTDEQCGKSGGACAQTFENGRISWSASTGAHVLSPTMATAWDALGAGGGTLGHPLTDTRCGLIRSGCYQLFQKGSLYSNPATGTHFARGAILDAWRTANLEFGVLGYPTTDETCGLSGSGCVQEFEKGNIYWTAKTGAYPVRGPLLTAYLAQRKSHPTIGYPTGAQKKTATGAEQSFTGGKLVYRSANDSVTYVPK